MDDNTYTPRLPIGSAIITDLVVSVLLHDCAMHISEMGFLNLLDDSEWMPSGDYFLNQ